MNDKEMGIKSVKELQYREYLNNKLESTSHVCVGADNNDDIDITDSHVKERATSNLPHRTCTKFFRLHYMHSECIHHISST